MMVLLTTKYETKLITSHQAVRKLAIYSHCFLLFYQKFQGRPNGEQKLCNMKYIHVSRKISIRWAVNSGEYTRHY